MALLYPEYPPELQGPERASVLTSLNDWSIAHGLAVRPPPSFVPDEQNPEGVLAATAPVTIFPSLFPRVCLEQGLQIQGVYNKLYSAITRDVHWLRSIISELLEIDDFVADLWKIYEIVEKEGMAQDLALGLFRSDYMLHSKSQPISSASPHLRQVEFNTIASSFGGLSSKVSALHKYLDAIGAYSRSPTQLVVADSLRVSKAAQGLTDGLALAHNAYKPLTGYPTCVLFLVQEPERNIFDQRHLEYSLLADHGVRSFRLPFHRTMEYTRISSEQANALIYCPDTPSPAAAYEVTTIYFRAGYSPTEYRGPDDWASRLHLERSAAIKCPSILTHLSGCKKIQQVLATPDSPHLARFLPDPREAALIRRTFAPIYPLDLSPAGKRARALATNPDTAARYVLKPQREGGGNNVYRRAIPAFLASIPESKWPAYILMEMIEPPAQRNAILRNGEVQAGGVICELGIYGVCLWSHKDGILPGANRTADYLLRTKGDQSEEGGVAAGFGAVDSVCLVDV